MIRTVVLAVVGLLILPHLSTGCWAFTWSRKINQLDTNLKPKAASPRINGAVLSPEEIDTLLLNQGSFLLTLGHSHIIGDNAIAETLTNYARRPDCFRRAAGLIRTRCGELDMDEDERVNAAISMTLCELATAKHYSIPFECVPFTVDSAFSPPGRRLQGECVDALSRSAQFWSSYSGYLREVPQLCFAFRRWHDIDTAREIYRNITLEKAALIQFIISREKTTDLIMRNWENPLLNLQETVSQMQAAASVLDTGVKDLHLHLTKEFDNVLGVLTTAIADLQVRQADRAYSLVRQTEASLAGISQHHSQGLQNLIPSLESALVNHIDSIFIQSRTDNQASLDLANEAHQLWAGFTGQIGDLTQSITILSATTSDITYIFNDSIQQAKHLHRLQHETSDSASHLAETIMHLTETAQSELEKINGSAAFIQERLLLQDYRISRWLIRTLDFFLPGIAPFNHFNSLPIFRIILTILDFIGYLCRLALSGIMVCDTSLTTSLLDTSGSMPPLILALQAIIIIFFSYRKYLPSFTPSVKSNFSPPLEASPPKAYCLSCPRSSLHHLDLKQIPGSVAPIPQYQRLRASRIPERLLRPIN